MESSILERWVDQYQNLIFSICYRLVDDYFEAQDLTQETFLAAYRSLDTFDSSRGSATLDTQNEKAWLTRIATNKCLDYRRQAARRQIPTEDTTLLVMSDLDVDASSPPETQYLEKETRQILQAHCSSLKAPYDEIALEYFYLEHSVDEIARKRGKNKKTIQTQIYRAREMLRTRYRKEADSG